MQKKHLIFTAIASLLMLIALAVAIPTRADWWQVVILGVVQGLTEFLPISSTGHLIVAADLLNYQGSIGGTFEIFIQLGTVISVIFYYAADLWNQALAVFGRGVTPARQAEARRFWVAILIAFFPAALIGVLARDFIKTVLFETPQVIATALIVGGMIFLAVERLPRPAPRTTRPEAITFGQAFAIGIAQCFALIPGVSRSGSTIVGGLLAGLDRQSATTFTFYLAIPILGAATLVDLLGSLDAIGANDIGALLLGAVTAMIVGYLSIGWLLRFVARNSFVAFGIYRIIAGLVIFALVALGQL